MSESEKTAIEIEQLHQQIKKMRSRNSMKENSSKDYTDLFVYQ